MRKEVERDPFSWVAFCRTQGCGWSEDVDSGSLTAVKTRAAGHARRKGHTVSIRVDICEDITYYGLPR